MLIVKFLKRAFLGLALAFVGGLAVAADTWPDKGEGINDFDPTVGVGNYIEYIASNTVGQIVVLSNNILTVNGEVADLTPPSVEVQMEDVEWADLTNRVAKGILAPGRQYRITDYETKSSQSSSFVESKPYMVIVTATSTNELSEVACAAHRTDNTTLAGDKVEAWKLWYSLYNDNGRFDWADTTSGKGVVYRMIDEHYNDIPYDFKCIKFSNISNSGFTLPDRAYGVVIKPTFDSNGKQILNGIVILNSCRNVTIEGGNMNLTLAYTNTFDSATDFIQNITVDKGVYTDSTRKPIYVPDKNQAYETEFRAPDSLAISVE